LTEPEFAPSSRFTIGPERVLFRRPGEVLIPEFEFEIVPAEMGTSRVERRESSVERRASGVGFRKQDEDERAD